MKRKQLKFSAPLLVQLFSAGIKTGYEVTKDPVPPDAKIVDCRFDGFGGNVVVLLVESDSFEEIAEGAVYPELLPAVQAVKAPAEPEQPAFLRKIMD